jgi:hypothetical protein
LDSFWGRGGLFFAAFLLSEGSGNGEQQALKRKRQRFLKIALQNKKRIGILNQARAKSIVI